MVYSDGKRAVRRARVYRSVAEKRRIVELTFLPGASVSLVAQAEGVNSHQVFDWRRAYRNGKLATGEQESCKLLPVIVTPFRLGMPPLTMMPCRPLPWPSRPVPSMVPPET